MNYGAPRIPLSKSPALDDEIRRELSSHILKNQYSFWAGMYVKRSTGPLTHNHSRGEGGFAFGSGRNTF
jgi:hypothetical protein